MLNISCMLTVRQIENRTKGVTRRCGWLKLKAGDLLRVIVKGQGLKRGERIKGLAFIRVMNVRREPLRAMLDDIAYGRAEVEREGFGAMSPAGFVTMFCGSHKGCTPDTEITRIEFQYIPGGRLS